MEAAREKFDACNTIVESHAAYNLACWHSLRNEPDECKDWLSRARDAGFLPSKEHLLSDDDLDNVRDADWFKEFVETLP